jgi:hypothetical protein
LYRGHETVSSKLPTPSSRSTRGLLTHHLYRFAVTCPSYCYCCCYCCPSKLLISADEILNFLLHLGHSL